MLSKRFCPALFACCITATGWAHAQDSFHASGEVGVGSSIRWHGDDRVTQRETFLIGSLEDSAEAGYYKAKGRVRYDARYEGNDPYSAEAADTYRFATDWRHLYFGYYLGDGELTVGWQQVVWGRADELRVLDQINPIDYRQGVTALLEESRIAVPMLRFTHPLGNWELETLWVTRFEHDRAPEPGSEFDAPAFATPDPAIFRVEAADDTSGTNGYAYGLNLTGQIGSVDTSFVALSARQPDPVYAIEGQIEDGRIQLRREFPRYQMFGGGLAADVGHGLVVRTELAYFSDWEFTNPLRTQGASASPVVNALFGIDYLFRDWLISAQWQEKQITDWETGMLDEERQHLFTVSSEASHYQDRLKSRLVLAFSPPFQDDLLLQGIFTYKPHDSIKLGLEVNVFFGEDEKLFGAYDERDHLKVSASYLY